MKRSIYSIVIVFIIFSTKFSIAQSSSSLDVFVGLNSSYRILSSPTNELAEQIIDIRNGDEYAMVNGMFGAHYNQRITNTLFFKTGFKLVESGFKTEKTTGLRWPSEHDGSGGYLYDPTLPHEMQDFYNHFFIEIPLILRKEFGTKKISPFIEIGLSPNIFLATKLVTKTDIGSESQFIEIDKGLINKVQFSGIASLGLNYRISDKLQFFIQPSFRYHFTNFSDLNYNQKYYNIGCGMGVRRNI